MTTLRPHLPEDRQSWKIASVTAHRDLGPTSIPRIRSAMDGLVKNPSIDAIYFGGAKGGDTEALKAALFYRTGRRPWLVVVVPDVVTKQPFETRAWTHRADEVIELKNPITSDDDYEAYTIRDQYLVDVGSLLVAFWRGNYKTGTGKTVRMAENSGLKIVRVPL